MRRRVSLDYVDDGEAFPGAVVVLFAGGSKLDCTCSLCVEGVVFAHEHVRSGEDLCPALAYDDRARFGLFTSIELGTEILRI